MNGIRTPLPNNNAQSAAANSVHASSGWTGNALSLAAAFAMGALLTLALDFGWPRIGFDFQYFLPRILDVRLHQLQEGWLAVQWWTPSFGAGLPAFPNPQHTQFMLAQFLVPALGLWGAAMAQAALFNALGTALVFHVCHRRLGCDRQSALLAGVTFGTCGFMWEHALTGHMGFNVFPLVAVVPEALHRQVPGIRGAALLALAAAVIVFGGGYAVVIIYALTCLLVATILPLTHPADYVIRGMLGRLATGAFGAIAATAVKVAAASLFLARFPRLADYRFEGSAGWEAPSLLWQLFGRRGVLLLSRWLPFSGSEGNGIFGRGEDVGFGPVTLAILLGGAVVCWHRRRGAPSLPRRWPSYFAAFLAIWLVGEFALGKGLIWPWLKNLPLLRSLHENHRLAAAFSLPIALAVAPCWRALRHGMRPATARAVFAVALIGTAASIECYFRARGSLWFGSYDATTVAAAGQRLNHGGNPDFSITRVAPLADDAGFGNHASSWKPYEPIFGYGYGGPEFRVRLSPGPVAPLPEAGGAWRFHDPRAFLAVVGAGREPFSLLPAAEGAALQALLTRRQPAWALPAWLRLAGWASVVAICLIIAGIAWPAPHAPGGAPLSLPPQS